MVRVLASSAARALLFLAGYWWIPFHRVSAGPQPTPAIVIGNHASYIEILYVMAHYDVCFVAKAEVASLPVVGPIVRALQCILVDRRDGKAAAMDAILKRMDPAVTAKFPMLCLYPEGTTTTGRCLISFKRGAFVPGRPVLPLLFHHSFDERWGFDPSNTCTSLKTHALGMCCQLYNRLTVTELPVYSPSPDERRDPELYAANVRQMMATAGHFPMFELEWEDKLAFDPRKRRQAAKTA